jgi:TonB family protein
MTDLILTTALKGTIVLAAAWIAAALLRRSPADLRHRIWLAALIAMALLLIPWPKRAPMTFAAAAELGAGKVTAAASRSLPLLPMLWLAGVALVLIRFGAGVIRLAQLTHSARVSDDKTIRISESIHTPMTWGAIRPVILLPAYVEDWPAGQRDVVIRHERAHIERRDWLWQSFAQAMTAIFWFHPLVWIAAAQLRQEAEHAADDATLATGIEGPDYADRLMAVARRLQSGSPVSAVAMVRKPALTSRIAAILDSGRIRTGASVGARIGVVLAAVALLVPLSAFQSRNVYHVGEDGVASPSVTYKVEPSYTPEAKEAKIQGGVVLNLVVNAQGRADDIQVTRSLDPGLDANAVAAVGQWLFKPGMKDGQPVDVAVRIEINFRLL